MSPGSSNRSVKIAVEDLGAIPDINPADTNFNQVNKGQKLAAALQEMTGNESPESTRKQSALKEE